jgi:cytochrome oxidase Cu insertion factor (SCO1/SenC/PrrC family)
MWTLPRGVLLLLMGAALTGCLAESTRTTRSSSHKPSDANRLGVEITGIDADGEPMQLSDYRGKVVLLDFWASY